MSDQRRRGAPQRSVISATTQGLVGYHENGELSIAQFGLGFARSVFVDYVGPKLTSNTNVYRFGLAGLLQAIVMPWYHEEDELEIKERAEYAASGIIQQFVVDAISGDYNLRSNSAYVGLSEGSAADETSGL